MNETETESAQPAAIRPGPKPLVDAALRRRRRARAFSAGPGPADDLHAAVADLVAERLALVTRPFARAAVFGAGRGAVAAAIADRPGLGEILEIEAAQPVAEALAAQRRAAPLAVPSAVVVGDQDASPLPPGSVDLVVSCLELHASADPVGALVQARLALAPDGLFLGVTVGGATLSELRAWLAEAEVETSGGLSPRVLPMAEIRDLGGLLQRAGFALPVADSDRATLRHASLLALLAEIRATGESNALVDRRRTPMRRSLLRRAAEIAAAHPETRDGRIATTLELVTLTAWAPAESQPQPLRPGSAKARLADALGVPERPAGERTG